MPTSTPKPAPSHFLPFAVMSAAYYGHIGFFNPYLPLWLKDLGLPLFTISLLTSVQAATRLFAPYGWGWLSDTTGERVKLLRYSSVVALACSLGLLWDSSLSASLFGAHSTSVAWLTIVLLLMFTHTSSMIPMTEAAMAHMVSSGGTLDTKRYGRIRVWGSIGFLVTVFFAGWWFERFGIGHFPYLTIATLTVVMLAVWRLPNVREVTHTKGNKPEISPVLALPEVRWFFVSQFFHVLAHMSIYIFLSLYLDELGYSKTFIGVMWALSVVVEIVWFYTQGRWLPKFSLRTWLVIAALGTLLRMGLMATAAQYLLVLLLAQALHALTFAAHHTVCIALVSHHFPGGLRGRGQALFTVIGYGLTGVTAGLAGGWLSTHYGLQSVFWAACGCAVLAMGAAWMTMRSRCAQTRTES
jgi:MFS transporter, PPP family, 3-phenylpropionic acid transporter